MFEDSGLLGVAKVLAKTLVRDSLISEPWKLRLRKRLLESQ